MLLPWVLTRLLAAPVSRPTLVHSYNLDEEQAAALRRNGAVVQRRLSSLVIGWLGQIMESRRRSSHEFAEAARRFIERVRLTHEMQ